MQQRPQKSPFLLPVLAFIFSATTADATRAEVTLLGSAKIAGGSVDQSGLTGELEDGAPANRLGGFGSAIAYTGAGDRFIAVTDRGPNNGLDDFKPRFQELEIKIAPGSAQPVSVTLAATTILTNESGESLTGLASAFAADNGPGGLRFDPEGIRVTPAGTVLVSDEYGPFVAEFSRQGKRLRTLAVPREFSVARPNEEKKAEISENTRGRVANHGFEGLALSPDGTKAFALLQGPLIQDRGDDGNNCRMLEIDLTTGKTRQLVVMLSDPSNGFNELLAINSHEFLAIERDGLAGKHASFKRIVKLDIAGASDVTGVEALPLTGLSDGNAVVQKSPFFDLLAPGFGLAGKHFPEKIEGLAFGPALPDGRRTLVVTSDNDFKHDEPTWVWVFAFDAKDLPGLATPRSK